MRLSHLDQHLLTILIVFIIHFDPLSSIKMIKATLTERAGELARVEAEADDRHRISDLFSFWIILILKLKKLIKLLLIVAWWLYVDGMAVAMLVL